MVCPFLSGSVWTACGRDVAVSPARDGTDSHSGRDGPEALLTHAHGLVLGSFEAIMADTLVTPL